ncbi:MAG: ABC transporter ATP-binding protein [Microthrixaceae bacterium]
MTTPTGRPTNPATDTTPVLSVTDLSVTFRSRQGDISALRGVNFDVAAGETVGLVGESGSGKSLTSAAIMGLLPRNAQVTGSVRLLGRELLGLRENELRSLRGRVLAVVAQDALTALNPVHTVGRQIAEAIAVHDTSVQRAALHSRAIDLLDLVGIPNAKQRADQFPHEFSGGMRQRVLIAMSVANEPELLIADEPTTALDVTVQAQVLDVLERIQDRTNTSVLLITHDLGVVAGVADRVVVMYSGSPVEDGDVDSIFYEPSHPYTRGLLRSLPRLDARRGGEPLFRIPGYQPSPAERPTGCAFHPRCDDAIVGVCAATAPTAVMLSSTHRASCHLLSRRSAVGQ